MFAQAHGSHPGSCRLISFDNTMKELMSSLQLRYSFSILGDDDINNPNYTQQTSIRDSSETCCDVMKQRRRRLKRLAGVLNIISDIGLAVSRPAIIGDSALAGSAQYHAANVHIAAYGYAKCKDGCFGRFDADSSAFIHRICRQTVVVKPC